MIESEERMRLSQLLGFIVCLAWVFSPAINVAIGQDGISLQVNAAGEGNPPSPGAKASAIDLGSEDSEAAIIHAASSELAGAVTSGNEDSAATATVTATAAAASGETSNWSSNSQQAEAASNSLFDGVDQADADEASRPAEVELSVKPGGKPLLPENRPAWVGASPDYSGKIHRIFVGSIPTAKRTAADKALAEPLMAAFNEYVDSHLVGADSASQMLQLDDGYIRRNLMNDPIGFVAELHTSQGPMYQKWVALEITQPQQKQIKKWYQEAVQRERLKPIGIGLVGLLGFVTMTHLLFRRKQGVASVAPLSREHMVASETNVPPVAAKRSSPFFGLAILAILLLAPLFFVVMLLAPMASHRESQVFEQKVTSPQVTHEMVEITVPEMPEMPDMPEMPGMPDMNEIQRQVQGSLHNFKGKVIIEHPNGGQSVTITTR